MRVMAPPRRVAPAAAAARFEHQPVAGADCQTDFLGADRARLLSARIERVAVRRAVFAAKNAAGAVHPPSAGGIGERRLMRFDDHLDDAAGAAAILTVAAGIRPEFVALEIERKANLGDFEAAELDPARRLPFAGAGPA